MAQVGIREFDAKSLLTLNLGSYTKGKELLGEIKIVLVTSETDFKKLIRSYPWLLREKLVVKPDQLFGKRGKNKLLLLNASWGEAQKFIKEKMGKKVTVGKTTGKLTHFLIEPFIPHQKEFYLAIKSEREGNRIYFSPEGGIEIEENWEKVNQVLVPVLGSVGEVDLRKLLKGLPKEEIPWAADFIKTLFRFYADLHFAYLEINPFTIVGGKIVPLDLVAKLDSTAIFECGAKWGEIEFPPPFGRELSKEEQFVAELDEKTGASLKLTILNPEGRIWTLVAGGGASIIYADTVCDLGCAGQLANYGEYSGDPTTSETYQYTRTILDLMTRERHPQGKVLLIGGGIANFTDVAKTFEGIIMALQEFREKLIKNKVKIYVRRGGPNYQEGLEKMRKLGETLGVPIEVYGPETHMTKIVSLALK